jgi:hypothetical protein
VEQNGDVLACLDVPESFHNKTRGSVNGTHLYFTQEDEKKEKLTTTYLAVWFTIMRDQL